MLLATWRGPSTGGVVMGRGVHMATHGAQGRPRFGLSAAITVVVFLIGFCILFYPTFADLWNQARQNILMGDYEQTVEQAPAEDNSAALEAARAYNASLDPSFRDAFTGQDLDATDAYWSLLDPLGVGIMGYVQIPKIGVKLPIYHGTSQSVLAHGLGHLSGTSLPVGGLGTHCVLSGHRGLPSALLLTDLDQLVVGDRFTLTVMGQKMAYEVDQVLVVDPSDVSSLTVDAAQDYVTLVTCTPYGVNTQRLLVRGRRVEWVDEPQVTLSQQVAASLGWRAKLLVAFLGLGAVGIVVVVVRRKSGQAKGAHVKCEK